MKTLILCAILCASWVLQTQGQTSNRPDLTMLYGDATSTCIASDNTLGYGLILMSETTSLKSLPKFEYRDINGKLDTSNNCDFENDEQCNKWDENWNWRKESSNDLPLAPVTDDRWEKFQVHYTNGVPKYISKHKYDKKIELRSNFYIGFSIRANENAQIVLCGGEDPTSDKCYWIILDGFKGLNETVLRKCVKGVPNEYPKNDTDCSKRRSEITEKLLDPSTWKHFLLTKEFNQIRLWSWNVNTKKKLLLDYTDDDNPVTPSLMFVRSYNSNVQWKIHEYNYLRLPNNTYITLPKMSFSTYICLSLYVVLCRKCTMKLDIYEDGGLSPIATTTINGDPEEQYFNWKNVRLEGGYSKSYLEYTLYVSLSGDEQFWAIDNIRTCSNNEFRIATVTDYVPLICQSLKYPDWTFNPSKETKKSEPPVCDNFKIGPNCTISCATVNSFNCRGHKICLATPTANIEAACTCASGYQWTRNNKCNTQCWPGTYGYRCEKKCGHCYRTSCNAITGHCDACEDGYLLPLCHQTLPYLVNAPKFIGAYYRVAIVRLDDVTMEGDERLAAYIQLECRPDGYATRLQVAKWFNCSDQTNIKKGVEITVTQLNKETKYQYRAVVYTTGGTTFRNKIPTEELETTCKPFLERNVIIKPESSTATISFESDDENCDVAHYDISINNGSIYTREENGKTIAIVKDLSPYRLYTIKMLHKYAKLITKSFWTAEDAPGKVKKLRCSNSSGQIDVSWEEPEEKNGVLRPYTVEYKLVKRNKCYEQVVKSGNIPSETNEIKINDLEPYNNYTITVFANTISPGEKSSITCETSTDSSISVEEFPETIAVSSISSNHAEFSFPYNCTNQRGPLFFDIFIQCMQDDWCDAVPNKTIENVEIDKAIKSSLTPFTNYLVTLQGKRAKDGKLTPIHKTTQFSTLAGSPSAVRSFDVYSRSEKYISIRWQEPRPPQGQLEDFELKISKNNIYFSKERNNLIPCNLWTEQYYCYTFTGLSKKKKYDIYMSAKNKESRIRGPVSITSAETKEDTPSVPLNLSHVWNDNQITLSWNHPNKTNGELKKFVIVLISNSTEITNKDNTTIYNITYAVQKSKMTYNYPITEKFPYSSSYIVQVHGVNSFHGENATLIIDTPPEKPELRESFTVVETTNTTITINISGAKPNTKSKISSLYVVVSKNTNNISKRETQEMKLKKEILREAENNDSWIAVETEITDTNLKVQIGNDQRFLSFKLNIEVHNKKLEPETKYDIIVVIMNHYKNKTSLNSYSQTVRTSKTEIPIPLGLWALLLLLLLPIAGYFIYKHIYKKEDRRASMMMMIPRLRPLQMVRTEDSHDPDVIPLTETTDEPQRTRPKKPAVAPKPGPSKSEENNGVAELIPVGTNFFHSRIVLLENLEDYLKEALENGELDQQHALFPRGQTKPWDYGMLKPNKFKNRYTNLIAYDLNRVKLEKINNDDYSDYINASYIHGYRQEKAYIATQGPKQATVNDFWRMVWQEKTQYIVMLANVVEGGKKKCEKYWPEINTSREYGNIEVYFEKSELYADYEYRTFVLTYKKETRLLYHLHFTSWPDHGVPLYPQSLVPFLKKMLTIPQSTAPSIVHCSAGVGRTGTIILCDICLRMAAREKAVDVLRYLHEIREQRANMVDNTDQYKLVHMILLECLLAPDTTIPCNSDLSQAIKKLIEEGGLQIQLNYLQQSSWQDKALNFVVEKQSDPANDSKNRVKDIVPTENQVYITRFPVNDEHSDYINAVPVDGFRFKEQFIVTQLPMPDTVKDFWRMVAEKSVKTIVSLNDIPENDPTCCIFWPKENEEMKPTPKITLKHYKLQIYNYYDVHSIILEDKVSQESFTVQVVQFKGWKHEKKLPPNEENLVLLWEETETLSHGNYPMIVTCYDGATASGLFVAMSFVIEKIKLEQQCDPCLAVRVIRRNRKQFVSNKVQFEFLYKSAVIYLSMFETYSNFQPVVTKANN